MRRGLRTALVGTVVLGTLVFAGQALASFTPKFSVTHTPLQPGSNGGTTIHVSFSQADDPVARMAMYAPAAYTATLNQAVGSTIGQATANVFSRTTNLTLPLQGQVVVGNPTDPTILAAEAACQYPGTPQAVWVLALSVAGQNVTIPVFVGSTAGGADAFGSTRIVVCLPHPQNAAQGAQLLDANFTVNGVFTVPAAGGQLRWEGLFTPYSTTATTVNLAGTVEARALLALPTTVPLRATYVVKSNLYRLSGSVQEGGQAVAGAKVQVVRGVSRSALRSVKTITTGSGGTFSLSGKLTPRKTTYFQARVTVPERDNTTAGCVNPLPAAAAPGGCVSATSASWSANSAVVRIVVKPLPKKKK
ncbi:MAG TPA: hypothetical protein VGF23_17175 [Gaiellaceae bacterium]|jgi:hypothetical protein